MTTRQATDIINWFEQFKFEGRFETNEVKQARKVLENKEPEIIKPPKKEKTVYSKSKGRFMITVYAYKDIIYFSASLVKKMKRLGWTGIEVVEHKIGQKKVIAIENGENLFYKNAKSTTVLNSKKQAGRIKEFFKLEGEKTSFRLCPAIAHGIHGFMIEKPTKKNLTKIIP